MATSGVTALSYSANEIFTEALDEIGVAADGETLSGNYFARCKRAFNLMLKQWQAQGFHLWTLTEGYLFPTKGTESFDFSTARLVNSYSSTTTSAASLSGASTLTVTSISGISDTDIIGVLLDTNVVQWTTVNGAPSGSTVTLTDALTSGVDPGAKVFFYSASATFTACERVLSARRRDRSDYDIELNTYARADYMNLPDKDQQSTPVVMYPSRQVGGVQMYLWPTVDREDIVIPFTYERTIEVITDSDDTLDIPEYWFNAIVLGLASRVAGRFGANPARVQRLDMLAEQAINHALTYDTEAADIRFNIQ